MRILITGGAGNLGTRLARHLLGTDHQVRLLVHKTELPFDLASSSRVTAYRADLANRETLVPACADADCIVHSQEFSLHRDLKNFCQGQTLASLKIF